MHGEVRAGQDGALHPPDVNLQEIDRPAQVIGADGGKGANLDLLLLYGPAGRPVLGGHRPVAGGQSSARHAIEK